jgi:uncharacterized protein (TIGR02996 family)
MTTGLLTEGDMLLESVLDRPEDDAPRLILADWLEEQGGQPERAGLIRLQVAKRRDRDWHGFLCLPEAPCRNCRKEARLLLGDAAATEDGLPRVFDWLADAPGEPRSCDGAGNEAAKYVGKDRITYTLRRGFVYKLCLPQQAFLDHASVIFSRHPVEEVVLADKKPSLPFEQPGWDWDLVVGGEVGVEGCIDSALWHLMYRQRAHAAVTARSRLTYRTDEDALASLSRACVQYGRQGRIRRGVGV